MGGKIIQQVQHFLRLFLIIGVIESFVRVKDYDGIMDVVCLLPCGKVFVEMQVAPEDFFDKRYAANVFSNQLKDVKKVISVSILGGRRDKEYVWGQEFMRCEEQSSHKILDEGIEILQYSIMNFDEEPKNMTDWVTFLTSAHTKRYLPKSRNQVS